MHNLSLNSLQDKREWKDKNTLCGTSMFRTEHAIDSQEPQRRIIDDTKARNKRSRITQSSASPRHTLRAQIKLNETNNLARVSNKKSERHSQRIGLKEISSPFIASGNNINIAPLGTGELINWTALCGMRLNDCHIKRHMFSGLQILSLDSSDEQSK